MYSKMLKNYIRHDPCFLAYNPIMYHVQNSIVATTLTESLNKIVASFRQFAEKIQSNNIPKSTSSLFVHTLSACHFK